MIYVAKAKRQLQNSATSIGSEMNADLSCFSAGVTESQLCRSIIDCGIKQKTLRVSIT